MPKDTVELYVKSTSNYQKGYPLTSFTLLSPIWQGESLDIPFGPNGEEIYPVVGWTDLFFGQACEVSCARVQSIGEEPLEGYLIWGGNSGVRVLTDDAEVEEWNAHLPAGYGYPFIWIEEVTDLPEEVRQVVEPEK